MLHLRKRPCQYGSWEGELFGEKWGRVFLCEKVVRKIERLVKLARKYWSHVLFCACR
jgi:hypothetical protein